MTGVSLHIIIIREIQTSVYFHQLNSFVCDSKYNYLIQLRSTLLSSLCIASDILLTNYKRKRKGSRIGIKANIAL